MAETLSFKIEKIYIYPFGGITKYDEMLNISILKEFLVLIAGPLMQMFFFILVLIYYKYGLIVHSTFIIIKRLNYMLLCFNMLPIVPLDGSKLVSLFFDKLFSYKTSMKLTCLVSVITLLVLIFSSSKLFMIILILFLIKSIYFEIINMDFKMNKFLLERYIYKLKFKKLKIIGKLSSFKRGYLHKIYYSNMEYDEKTFLELFFKEKYRNL